MNRPLEGWFFFWTRLMICWNDMMFTGEANNE